LFIVRFVIEQFIRFIKTHAAPPFSLKKLYSNADKRVIIKTLLSRFVGIVYFAEGFTHGFLQFFSVGLLNSYRYIIIVEVFSICQAKKREISMYFENCLERLRKEFNKSNAELEKFLHLSNGYISKINENPGKLLLALNNEGISTDWFLTGEGEMYLPNQGMPLENISTLGFKRIPIYSKSELPEGAFVVPLIEQRLSAGGGSFLPDEDVSTALVRVPAYLARFGKNIAALTVDGDSMYPTLSRGDMVVCDSCGWSGEGVYGLRMSGEGFVKRLTKAPGKLVIISDNPKYPVREELEESQDIQIIGRVHCAIKELE
jgi:phage repressor protein C with HTH and peptisase S24 domain